MIVDFEKQHELANSIVKAFMRQHFAQSEYMIVVLAPPTDPNFGSYALVFSESGQTFDSEEVEQAVKALLGVDTETDDDLADMACEGRA